MIASFLNLPHQGAGPAGQAMAGGEKAVRLPAISTMLQGAEGTTEKITAAGEAAPGRGNDREPKRKNASKRQNFSPAQRDILISWLREHISYPYPSLVEKENLVKKTGLTVGQISIWFTNNRVRSGMTCSSFRREIRGYFPAFSQIYSL